jgi:flavin-dependent thymidylate synthase
MYVELIDCTGFSAPSPADYAARLLIYTKNTRLEQGKDTRQKINRMTQEEMDKELDYISKTIRSSWEFVDYTFEVHDVTRAYTHQQVRTRTASYAQQAQRVVDMSEFETLLPKSVVEAGQAGVWKDCMLAIGRAYKIMKNAGVPAQDVRGVLPTNVLTNIIIKMNLRTLADLVGKRDNPRAQGEYTDVIQQMIAVALMAHPWIEPFLYPARLKTPALDAILRRQMGLKSPIDMPELNQAMKELDGLKGTWG